MNTATDQKEKLTLYSFRVRRGFTMALLFVVGLAGGSALERWVFMGGFPADAQDEFRLIAEAWKVLDKYYVDRPAVRHNAMAVGAINGMTEALGDAGHSVYLSPTEANKATSAVQGMLNGIGVEITQNSNHQTVVVSPIDGSPAQQAGLRSGDVILQVDGHSIAGLPMSHVSARMMGEVGQPIELTVENLGDGKRHNFKIVRAAIKLNNVSWQRLPGLDLAHLRIGMFSDGETEDLRKALKEIKGQGIRGIILDIRNNPGGVLDEAIGTASQFLKSGNVLWEKNAGNILTPVPVRPGGVATDIPMVVLINGASASDSEIVAGALHDAGRARLIGDTTLGTGTVLSQFKLNDDSALLLATQEWLTPKKVSFWHRGIAPDVKVTLSPAAVLRPSAERQMTPDQLRECGDRQILKAIEVLTKEITTTRGA